MSKNVNTNGVFERTNRGITANQITDYPDISDSHISPKLNGVPRLIYFFLPSQSWIFASILLAADFGFRPYRSSKASGYLSTVA